MALQQPNKLPKKEQDLFRDVIQLYETKQYKKGVKAADQILAKFPNHGETQAMKGLIFNSMGNKEAAYELVKAGLKNDLKSHVCWHVYGLMYKSDSNYKEASKCFLNALRTDPDNQSILRDLSWLQIQVRDIQGFLHSRSRILNSKPQLRQSWVGFAVANFIAGEYQVAVDMINKFQEAIPDRGDAYEESELLLFQSSCFERMGLYREALQHLSKHTADGSICDKLFVKIKSAELQVLLGEFDEAVASWTALVRSQGDNYRLHAGLQTALLQLDPDTSKQMFALTRLETPATTLALRPDQLALLDDYYTSQQFRNGAKSIAKIQLTLVPPDSALFKSRLDVFLQRQLHSGIPSLYQDVCSYIRHAHTGDSASSSSSNSSSSGDGGTFITNQHPQAFAAHPVTQCAVKLVEGYISHLQTHGTFGPPDAADTSGKAEEEPPTALLWALFLKAHLQEMSGALDDALATIEQCIEHTPTALDMYLKKGRILKDLGAALQAAHTVDTCRQLDLQDRYLNNKATKYLMRAGQVTQGNDTIAMFTKHDGDPQQTLFDLQCNWYELEAGEALAKQKKFGMALKKFSGVQKHFIDYYEDMFDFHHYCIRKSTLRMYNDVLAMQDNVYSHKYYQRGLRGAVSIYLHLLDHPEDQVPLPDVPAESPAAVAAKAKANAENQPKKDEDPVGNKLLMSKSLLNDASLWCSHAMARLHVCTPETIALVAEVQRRRGKFVQAMRAIHCGVAKTANRSQLPHPDIVVALVKIADQISPPATASPNESVNQTLLEDLASLLGPANDLEAYVRQYVDRTAAEISGHSDSDSDNAADKPARMASAVQCLAAISREEDVEALFAAVGSPQNVFASSSLSVHAAVKFIEFINGCHFLSADTKTALLGAARTRFPKADAFKSSEDREAEEKELFGPFLPSSAEEEDNNSSSNEAAAKELEK